MCGRLPVRWGAEVGVTTGKGANHCAGAVMGTVSCGELAAQPDSMTIASTSKQPGPRALPDTAKPQFLKTFMVLDLKNEWVNSKAACLKHLQSGARKHPLPQRHDGSLFSIQHGSLSLGRRFIQTSLVLHTA